MRAPRHQLNLSGDSSSIQHLSTNNSTANKACKHLFAITKQKKVHIAYPDRVHCQERTMEVEGFNATYKRTVVIDFKNQHNSVDLIKKKKGSIS